MLSIAIALLLAVLISVLLPQSVVYAQGPGASPSERISDVPEGDTLLLLGGGMGGLGVWLRWQWIKRPKK